MLTRRSILQGAILCAVAPSISPAAAQSARGVRPVEITTSAERLVKAALALPARTPAPAVIVIHEWWGLTDDIKLEAARLAAAGYIGLAVDLFDGKIATLPDEARANVHAMRPSENIDVLTAWLHWLREHPKGNGKVATLGFSFGGGWALGAALAAAVDAVVVYYGNVARSDEELRRLTGPVLGHFAILDQFINPAMVQEFTAAMSAAGKKLETYSYLADHGFASRSATKYDAANAAIAWRRSLAFLKRNLTA